MNLRTNSRIPHFAPLCTCFGDFSGETLPFWAGKAYHKGKKAVEQMSEFWMSYEMIARRYGPGYQGYPLFGAVHLGELEAVAVCILLTARWYCRSPERTRRRILWGVTVLLLADEAVLVIAMLATGQWNWSYLPLHLCSIHIFLCTTCTLTGKDWCKEELYALCAPGAAIALLCPGWLGTKAWSLINLHSVTLHGLLVLYPVLLVAGGFRPQVRRLPAVLAFLFGSALPIYFLNKVLYTNFYFLNGPTSSPVTALFTQWFGEQWYLLGFLPAVALVLAGMYLPWYIHRKK